MKVSLVVASGVHEGKVIPINAVQFLIGRDPQCQLRPASQAVSKQHCAIITRDDVLVIQDYGSTNGTIVNEEVVRGEERVINHNDRVKVGPLDFTIRVDASATHKALGASLPDPIKKKAVEALAAVQAVVETSAGAAALSETPGLKAPSKSDLKKSDSKKIDSKTMPKVPAEAAAPAPAPKPKPKPASEPNNDDIAAMLLGMSDDEDAAEKVPDGSTVMEMPTSPTLGEGAPAAPPSKPGGVKTASREDTSNAASEILRKMLRRPR